MTLAYGPPEDIRWRCGNCKTWVVNGTTHKCGLSDSDVDRIADRIVDALEFRLGRDALVEMLTEGVR